MYRVYFDAGTTNIRAYLLQNEYVLDKQRKSVGSRDVSVTGSNTLLLENLYSIYNDLLNGNKLQDDDIAEIYASGMVTSPFGIKEVPHLSTPLSIDKLQNNLYVHPETIFFGRNLRLIRGVKTVTEDFNVTRDNFNKVNNMRGEEIEVFGILTMVKNRNWKECGIFLPGSHTHIVRCKNGVLQDIISTFSGELFRALKKETILADSIDLSLKHFDKEMIELGAELSQIQGINRALYLVNTMQVFTEMSQKEKTSFLEGVLTAGVIKIFQQEWPDIDNVIISAPSPLPEVYHSILKWADPGFDIKVFHSNEENEFSVRGLIEMLNS